MDVNCHTTKKSREDKNEQICPLPHIKKTIDDNANLESLSSLYRYPPSKATGIALVRTLADLLLVHTRLVSLTFYEAHSYANLNPTNLVPTT